MPEDNCSRSVCTYGQCIHHLWKGGRLSARPLNRVQKLRYDPRLVVVQLLHMAVKGY